VTLSRKVGVEGYLVDLIYNRVDDAAVYMIIADEERGGTYVVTMLVKRNREGTDSASSGRSWSSRMNTSTRTRRSLL
jgi:hypothetical protein